MAPPGLLPEDAEADGLGRARGRSRASRRRAAEERAAVARVAARPEAGSVTAEMEGARGASIVCAWLVRDNARENLSGTGDEDGGGIMRVLPELSALKAASGLT